MHARCRSVGVLGRGRRWSNTEFPRSPAQIARDAFWDPGHGHFGLVEYEAFDRMHVIEGCGVGGGSLHYFNVHVRPPDAVFDDDRWPSEITGPVLAPYFDLARDMLDVAPPAGRALPRRTEAFQDACRGAGRTPELVDIAVYTGPPRTNPHGGDPQLPCEYSGNCGIGCHVHAKNTLDLNYLRVAEGHGAGIYPLHEVDRIAPQPGGRLPGGLPSPGPAGSERAAFHLINGREMAPGDPQTPGEPCPGGGERARIGRDRAKE